MRVGRVYFWSNRYEQKEPAIEMTMDGDIAEIILDHLKGDITEAAEAGLLDDCIALADACAKLQSALGQMGEYDAFKISDMEGYAE